MCSTTERWPSRTTEPARRGARLQLAHFPRRLGYPAAAFTSPGPSGLRGRGVGGVTSYGLNGNCAGTGGVYRVDLADDLNWLTSAFSAQLR